MSSSPQTAAQGAINYQGLVPTQTVDPSTETVGGQLTSLLSTNNPYIQMAKAGAQQQAASRGMLNSTMAAGAGQNAAIQAALPIAQGNAQEYANVGAQNQQAATQIGGAQIAGKAEDTASQIQASAQEADTQAQVAAQEAMQTQQLAQQQSQFNTGEGNWTKQFNQGVNQFNQGQQNFEQQTDIQSSQFNQNMALQSQNLALQQNQFTAQQADWQQSFGQNQQNYETNLDFQNYWNGEGMKQSMNNNIFQLQATGLQDANMTPDQRTAFLNQVSQMGQAYEAAGSVTSAFMPPWQSSPAPASP